MAQVLIDHVAVDVRIRFETTSISRVTQAITLLLDNFTLFRSLLANLLNFLDIVFALEVFLFNLLYSILILLLELIKFIHTHVHNIFFSIRVSDHDAQVRRQLIKVELTILSFHCALRCFKLHLILLLRRKMPQIC